MQLFYLHSFRKLILLYLLMLTLFTVFPSQAIESGTYWVFFLYSGPGVLRRFFQWTPLRWIGLISFSLYLWHGPLINALTANVAPILFKDFRGIVALSIFAVLEMVVIISISFILYVLVEKPGMHLSEQLRKRMQKYAQPELSASSEDFPSPDKEFDPEKTEPRQPVVLAETSSD